MKSMFITLLSVLTISIQVFAGGMSGGGGNVLNPNPPKHALNPDRVDEMISRAFQELPAFLKRQEVKYNGGQLDSSKAAMYAKIFTGSPNIFEAIKSRKLHIEEDASCLNSFDIAYDASIVSIEPNSVCISAFTISKKVILHEIYPQVSALLVHEYSEVMGFDDEMAINIQTLILADIKNQ